MLRRAGRLDERGQRRGVQRRHHRHAEPLGPGERLRVQAVVVDQVDGVGVAPDEVERLLQGRDGPLEVPRREGGVGGVRLVGPDGGRQPELGRAVLLELRPFDGAEQHAVAAGAEHPDAVPHHGLEAAGVRLPDGVPQRCDDGDRAAAGAHAACSAGVRTRSYRAGWAAVIAAAPAIRCRRRSATQRRPAGRTRAGRPGEEPPHGPGERVAVAGVERRRSPPGAARPRARRADRRRGRRGPSRARPSRSGCRCGTAGRRRRGRRWTARGRRRRAAADRRSSAAGCAATSAATWSRAASSRTRSLTCTRADRRDALRAQAVDGVEQGR